MGYRSSPTCSHCWKQGHTKRFCPTMREKAAKWLETHKHLEGRRISVATYFCSRSPAIRRKRKESGMFVV